MRKIQCNPHLRIILKNLDGKTRRTIPLSLWNLNKEHLKPKNPSGWNEREKEKEIISLQDLWKWSSYSWASLDGWDWSLLLMVKHCSSTCYHGKSISGPTTTYRFKPSTSSARGGGGILWIPPHHPHKISLWCNNSSTSTLEHTIMRILIVVLPLQKSWSLFILMVPFT